MKRRAVIATIKQGAKAANVNVEFYELSRHTGVRCGGVSTTIPRHTEIANLIAETIFKQLEPALGERWWKK